MMGTHRKAEQGVIQSSIALLQERFKQLQRVKEMREKRELVRIFSSDHFSNNINTPSSVTLTTTTTTTTTNNSSPTITDSHSTMLFAPPNNYYHDYSSPHHQHKKFYDDDDNDDDYDNNNNNNDDKLQIFLPPNYYNYCTTHNNRSSPSSSTSSSSSSFQDNNNLSRQNQNQDEVSLSLWPPVSSAINQFQSAREITGAYKSEVYSHVQDVDTTLHL